MLTNSVALNRKNRRRILLILTLSTVLLAVIGFVFAGEFLENRPRLFVVYWVAVFVAVMTVLGLALLDMRMVRKEYRLRQDELDTEYAQLVSHEETSELSSLQQKEDL